MAVSLLAYGMVLLNFLFSFSGDNLSYSFVSDDWSSQVLSMKARPVSESLSRASSGCSTLASVADI